MLTIIEGRKKHYQIPFQVTRDTELQWLQYRINYRILATNSYLFKIKYIDSDTCSFCNIETETITHLLWDCIYINPLLGEFVTWVKNTSSENFELCFYLTKCVTTFVEILYLLSTNDKNYA